MRSKPTILTVIILGSFILPVHSAPTPPLTPITVKPGSSIATALTTLQPHQELIIEGHHTITLPSTYHSQLGSSFPQLCSYFTISQSNVTITFAPGATLVAQAPLWAQACADGDPPPPGCRSTGISRKNVTVFLVAADGVTIRGTSAQAPGLIIGPGKDAQYGFLTTNPQTCIALLMHGVCTYGHSDITITNLTIEHLNRDALFVTGRELPGGPLIPSTNVHIDRCNFNFLRHAAVEIVDAHDVFLTDCVASEVWGYELEQKRLGTAAIHVETALDRRSHFSQIHIMGCRISDSDYGIRVIGKGIAHDISVIGNTVAVDNTAMPTPSIQVGISVTGTDRWLIASNVVDAHQKPSFCIGVSNDCCHPLGSGSILDNECSGGSRGISVARNQNDPAWGYILVHGNRVSRNTDGIVLSNPQLLTCSENVSSMNSGNGMVIEASANDVGPISLFRNVMRDNGLDGIAATGRGSGGVGELYIVLSSAHGNQNRGIALDGLEGVRLIKTMADWNSGVALEVTSCKDVIVRDCRCLGAVCGQCVP